MVSKKQYNHFQDMLCHNRADIQDFIAIKWFEQVVLGEGHDKI